MKRTQKSISKRKLLKLLLIICICLSLSGCWDKIEIEDRLFIGSISFDKVAADKEIGKYLISYTSAVPSAIKEGKDDAVKTFNTEADTIELGTGLLQESLSQQLFFGHTRLVIFSEAVMKDSDGFKRLLDALMRSHEFHKSMDVYVTQHKTEEVLKVRAKFDPLFAYYITGIADNNKYSSTVQRITLDDFITKLVNNEGDAVIPKIEPGKEEVRLGGLGLIKDYKMAGYLNDEQGRALRWLTNDVKGGRIDVKIKEIPVVFRYFEFKSKKKLDKVENGKIYITYKMQTEGSIEEYELGKKLLEDENVKEAEKKVNEQIKKSSELLIKALQEQYKVDVIEVRDYLSKHHPKLYDQIKKDFDNYFADNIVINVEVDAKIRRGGTMQ